MSDDFILLVDDSRFCLLQTGEVLCGHGFNVLQAACALEALAMLDGQERVTALVTDIDLGDGPDGFEIARRARALFPELPVVYVSGSDLSRHGTEGVPGSEFIAKPYRRQRVVEALNRVISRKAA